MDKKWHTKKTKPRQLEDVLVIYKDGIVDVGYATSKDGERIEIDFWEDVVLWQYTCKLFEKELKQVIRRNRWKRVK